MELNWPVVHMILALLIADYTKHLLPSPSNDCWLASAAEALGLHAFEGKHLV
jgi:hypothetical protein